MRIVHEIYGKAQVSGTVDQYTSVDGPAPGGGCDLVLDVPGPTLRAASGDEVQGENEVIHIEGDVDDVIDMLQSALDVLRAAAGDDFVFGRSHEGFPRPPQKGHGE